MEIRDGAGRPICDWRDWTRPKKAYQWKSGRSAMELARAWFVSPVPIVPKEVLELLRSRAEFESLELEWGAPEYVTPLPERGEGRNHDLILVGSGPRGKVVISIEAKADESFGATIGEELAAARASKRPTRKPQRIETLVRLVFGDSATADDEQYSKLRYQLLTAVAGTVLEAKRQSAHIAAFLVHEFVTESVQAASVRRNEDDLSAFLGAMHATASSATQTEGRLAGPFSCAGASEIALFAGKVRFDWDRGRIPESGTNS